MSLNNQVKKKSRINEDPFKIVKDYIDGERSHLSSAEDFNIFCLGLMQLEFNSILSRYINDRKILTHKYKGSLYNYLTLRNSVISSKYEENKLILIDVIKDKKFNVCLKNFIKNQSFLSLSDVIVFLYRDMKDLLERNTYTKEFKTVNINKDFNYATVRNKSPKYRIINLLKKEILKIDDLVETCFVQGSFGTEDFLENWSDLDAVLVFNNRLFEDSKNLIQARKIVSYANSLFYCADPLAHHYFHMATCLDLSFYSQSSMLPMVVYENGMKLVGKNKLSISLRKDLFEQVSMVSKLERHFEYRIKNIPKNAYELKLDLAHLFLLPSFLLQAKGIYVYKRDSFELVKKEFPEINFDVIDKATTLMKEWKTSNIVKYYPTIFWNILPHVLNKSIIYIYIKLSRNKKLDLSPKEISIIMSEISDLFNASEKTLLNLLKND
ncbi:hypothetical protein HOE22_07860 [Candidatus Woesearchaeota archaeon]|jgi:hypothetical protein|nr:hypothetical protein [Candidatus Woesearchaeota archaeon]MBT4733077.1 hypothetical protein [Candidatus Woesearchaeota archaeon]